METHCYTTLHIDDDADDREVFATAVSLLPLNIQHTNARSGHDGIQLFLGDPGFLPDMIFLDLNMPKMNGIECYAELRKIERLAATPICIYSTNLEMTAGVFQDEENIFFLEKPTDINTLKDAITDLLENISHLKQQTTND